MSADHEFTLGEYLRQEREKRGLSIEQVASVTKISVRLLHSLEADQYGDLPAKPFIRGFVTSYARFIGIDPREVLIQYGTYIEEKSHDRPSREGGHSGYAFEKREGDQGSRIVLGVVMGAFIVFGGIAYIILKPSLKHHRSSHAEKLRAVHATASPSAELADLGLVLPSLLPSPVPSVIPSLVAAPAAETAPAAVVSTRTPQATQPPAPSPSVRATSRPTPRPVPSSVPHPVASLAQPVTSPSAAPEASDPLNSGVGLKGVQVKYKLIIKALESVWVRYQVDSRKAMVFILRQGRVLVLRAESTMRLQVSKPSDVSISLNGRPQKPYLEVKSLAVRQDDPTLIFPTETIETIKEPFPGEKPLLGRSVPQSPRSNPSAVPAQ